MLLGVDGVCIISHGSIGATAMVNAIGVAPEMVEVGLVDELRAAGAGRSSIRRRCLPRRHVEQGPLGRDEIFEIVRDRLADILEIEPSTITEGSRSSTTSTPTRWR